MNKDLMKKLVEQAGGTYTMQNIVTTRENGLPIEVMDRFAELIVRECACKASLMRHVYPHQAELTATTLLNHFGVKP